MDLPPTIPTSFVPHTSAAAQRRFRFDFIGAFSLVAYFILFVVMAMAIGVYAYGKFLQTQSEAQSAELKKAKDDIVESTAEGLVRLNDRLNSSQELLSQHVAFSRFLTALGEILPTTVRFSSIQLTQVDSTKITLSGNGVAKNFNALAELSRIFSSDSRIKEAVFSGITVNKDSSVNFNVAAQVDPKVVAYVPSTSTSQSALPMLPMTGTTTNKTL